MEDKRKIAADLMAATHIRTFEIVQYVTGYVDGGMDDWPTNLQDRIYAALERKAHEVQLPLKIVHSYCNEDIDSTDERKRFYVHVIASEIVVKIEAPRRLH